MATLLLTLLPLAGLSSVAIGHAQEAVAQDPDAKPDAQREAAKPAGAEATSEALARAVIQKLATKQEQLSTMSARFTQEVSTPLTRRPIVSKGTLSFRREPACACFTITEPRPAVVRFDAHSYQVYRPEQARAERFLLEDGDLAGALVQVLAPTHSALEQSFRATATRAADGIVAIELTPVTPKLQQYFTQLTLSVDEAKSEVRAIGYQNREGDEIQISLSEVQLDPVLAPATFAKDLPEGTEVLVHQLKKS